MPNGLLFAGIGVPAVLVAIVIGTMVSLPWLVTYAVIPLGAIAIYLELEPTGIGVPAVFVVRSIGVTV